MDDEITFNAISRNRLLRGVFLTIKFIKYIQIHLKKKK